MFNFLKTELQKNTNRWKKKRVAEYSQRSLKPDEAIAKIFPGQIIAKKILQEIEPDIDKFIEEMKNKQPFTYDNY